MFFSKLRALLALMEINGAISALVSWPKFSMASFLIISRLKKAKVLPKTVIDVGANVGQFAVAASRLFKEAQIYSIEPDPITAELLRKNTSHESNVSISVVALGESIGEAKFYVNRDSQVSSLLPLGEDRISSFPGSVVERELKVPISTLDTLFLVKELEAPILLKIDVQGFEDRVIRGGEGFLKVVEWVLIEVSFANLYQGERDFQSIQSLLKGNGFEFSRPMNFHTSPLTGEIIEMDALFRRAKTN
ncbi:MAG: FkbM family methyltransferase [Sideroxydans sp.]|nr:FkbM family methyltransferase [Sideroxydans sp.]